MANPTTNYGFVLPTPTDLVTDLPADFDVALQGVDTRLKALQPGTTLGDLAYSSATANTNTRLPIGTSGQVLAVSGGGVPAWTTTADVTPLTTKGDLFTFTTADARLGVGTNGQILVADSAESTGLKWATPAGGKLLQVVYAATSTSTTIASTTFTDTTLTATITPTLNTSKIMVITSLMSGGGRTNIFFQNNIRLVRGSTNILAPAYAAYPFFRVDNASATQFTNAIPFNYLDSPATTSATTYKIQGKAESTADSGYAQFQFGDSTSTIMLLEIGA